jgi:hypothetical protein
MDIMLPGKKALVPPSAIVQARQRLGAEAVKNVFLSLAQHSFKQSQFETWSGLNLFAVDDVVWRTHDSPENHQYFGSQGNGHTQNIYPKVRMECQMELTSHQ